MFTQNLTIYQGATFSGVVTATGVSLSGYSVRSKIRESYSSTTGIYDFTCNVLAGADGVFSLYISPTGTAWLPPNRYFFDAEAYNPGDIDVIKLCGGNVDIYPEATY